MQKNKLKNNKTYLHLIPIRRLLNIMGIKPIHIILPIILSFMTSFLDCISLVLLIPLIRGIIADNLTFVSNIPVLSNIIAIFPKFKLKHLVYIELSTKQSVLLSLISVILFIVILKNIISYINLSLSKYWFGKFELNTSTFIFKRYMSFGKLFFDRTNKGYITLVLRYSHIVMRLFDLLLRSVIAFFSLLMSISIMFMISWKLTIVMLLVFPFLHYSLKSIINRLGKLAGQKKVVRIQLSEKIINIFSCIPLVKAYSKERETEEIYGRIKDRLRKLNFRSAKISNLIRPIQQITITGFFLFMILIVGLFFTRGNPTKIAAFIIFFYIARQTLPSFNVFNNLKKAFKQREPMLKELLKNLDDKDKFFVAEGQKIFNGPIKSIDFCHLNFSYIKGVAILKDINFSIEKGKTTAIVGSTGAGKTTLINLIMHFYDCPPSSILIDGVDIRDFTLKSLRAHMSLVSQEVWLFNDTLRNNMIFGLDNKITDDQLIDIAKKSRLYDLVMQLPDGFDTKVGDRGVKLSGGEKQRVAIARSLLKNSEILILDEATSSLDSKTEGLIQGAIDEAIKERTAIVIAHRLSTLKHADKIVVIENGCFIEEGSLSELIEKKGAFYKYWETQRW